MITSFNPNNELYTHLFSKAWQALYNDGKLTDAEIAAGKFTSLDQYFAHMKDLSELDPVYMMIPLDEQTEGIFKINANDRTIAIPAQFSKCAGVKNDNFCEIIVFTIDRYFDFQDLNETQICIQWINANNDEGISHICLRDVETFPGKLRFGWPLTTNITGYEGPVKFAVRFYTSRTNGDEVTIDYVLNTLEHTITIKPTLNIDRLSDKVITETISGDIFNYVVKNSQNPSFEVPATPMFRAPGKELETVAAIDSVSDKLTLRAQAVANDNGVIDYEWKFIPAGKTEAISLNNYSTSQNNDLSRTYYTRDKYELITMNDDFTFDGAQKYFIKNDDGNYIPYTDFSQDATEVFIKYAELTINPKEDVSNDSENRDPEEIVGKYYVEAVNTTIFKSTENSPKRYVLVPYNDQDMFDADKRTKYERVNGRYEEITDTEWDETKTYYIEQEYVRDFTNSTIPTTSAMCTIPAPHSIEITKNLPIHQFIGEDGFATLDIDVKEDETNPLVKYDWRLNDDSENMEEAESAPDSDADSSEYKAAAPGWYKVNITSNLNRKEEAAGSAVCKVTNKPEAPKTSVEGRNDLGYFYAYTTKINDIQKVRDFIDGTYSDEELKWERGTDDATILQAAQGTILLMKIVTDLSGDNISTLLSDELNYSWKVQDLSLESPYSDWRPLTQDDQDSFNANSLLVAEFDLNSNILVARLPNDRATNTSLNFACDITNIIHSVTEDKDEKATLDTATEYTFTFI